MTVAYLLNPAGERLENPRRKARKSKRKGRKGGYYRSAAWMAKIRKLAKRGRRKKTKARRGNKAGWFASKPKGAHRVAYTHPKRKKNPGRRRKSHGKKRRSGGRRKRNPGGIGGISLAMPEIFPLRLPLPGIIGQVVNGVVQGAFAGGIVFGGFVLSGVAVDMLIGSKAEVEASGSEFKAKWARPLAFGALAGITGGVVAAVAPKGKKATWALLAAAGPAIRFFAGLYVNLVGDKLGPDALNAAGGLADYLQVGDLYEAGMGNGEEITDTWGDNEGRMMDDYLQVGDLYEAGMGERDVFAPA